MKTRCIFATLFLITLFSQSFATNYTWTGNSGTSWNTSGSWSPSGVPDSTSNVTIVSATNAPVLDQNRKVSLFTMTSGTLDLNSYTLTSTGNSTFTSGTISNGVVKPTGNLCHFGGTTFNATLKASCGYFHMNGGLFNSPVELTSAGTSSTSGTGGCIFEDSLTINHGGTLYFTMGSSGKDIFNGPVTVVNSGTHEVYLATGDSAFFNGNLILNSTNNGGINFGTSGGVSTLAYGKTISIGSTGFTNDYLTLKNFNQTGATSQTLTLTGTAIVNLISCTFNGNLTLTTPGFLLKDNVFNGTATLTRNGSSGNHQSDGGNTFNNTLTIDNAGSVGRIRMATTTGDTFNDNATFNSTGGQDVQICYTGNSYFYGDITISSNKVVFNTASGKVTLAGGNSQSLNGSYNFPFKQLAIDKSAGFVTVNAICSVDDSLFLVKGYFLTKSTNLITLKAGAKVTGASKNSYIDGPVKKIGNTAFIFPTGKNNSYRPIEMSAPSTTTSEFTGEFLEDSVLVHTTQRDSSLGYLIRNKYWKLNRNAGSSQVYITLAWDSLNALVDTFVNVASWNGSQWKNLGKCPIVGTSAVGSIKSASSASAYYEFSLGYGSLSTIPFPPNCQSIESESDLRFCLSHASGEINVTADFFIDAIGQNDPAMSHFPIFVPSYIILNGLPGSNSPKWWEAGCPVISTNFTAEYHVNNSAFPVRNVYLFEMATGSTIQNLRIRGASCDVKEYNDAAILCGGVYIMEEIGQSIATISNCEISCFSQAGVWKSSHPEILNLINCYVHKVRGKTESGIGYGVWSMGDLTPTPTVNFTNCIFDDCKAAIDGQGYPINWNILHCSLSQFFQSEDIHMHNYNEFHSQYVDNNTNFHSDCHIKYPCSISLNNSFNGLASDLSTSIEPVCTNTIVSSYSKKIDPCIVYNDNMTYIPMYDIGGADITVQNTIFHKNWKLGTNGNLSLKFPNRDTSHNGVADNKIDIQFNTFSTFRFTPTEAWYCSTNPINYNNTGYAKISDNYIDASVWSADPYNIVGGNYFDYKRGDNVAATAPLAPQPCELTIDLKTGTTSLNESYTKTPYSGKKYIQYAQVGDPIKIDVDLSNATGATSKYFIIRPNTSENAPVGNFESHVVSNQNYFYNDEIYTQASTSPTYTFNQPGLYGIDVMGFDVASTSGNYEFKASAWEHIPVIIVPVDQQMLYFNIKDSYRKDGAATGVKKQAYLNELLIWEEDIAAGGTGWELVEVDLKDFAPNTTTEVISVLHKDGSPNVLSFSIYLETGISTNEVAGVFVWVDDVYIPKTSSLNGDNLIKDGTMELSDNELCLSCNWFQNETGASTTLGCGTTDVGINSLDRKSGSNAIYLKVPYVENCTYNNSQGEIVASVGTNIDFTDLLSCDDYEIFHDLIDSDFINVSSINYQNKIIHIGSDLTIPTGKSLVLEGCLVVVESDQNSPVKITVESGGTLQIVPYNNSGTWLISHLFSCSDMWQGIVNEGGIIDMVNMPGGGFTPNNYPSLIEDAIEAIQSTQGDVNIRYAKFKNNQIGIQLINYDKSPANTSNTEGFLGIEFSCTDNILSKAPHPGEQSFANFDLIDVVNVHIGGIGSSPSGFRNMFADAIYGIRSSNSNGIVINNEFDNIGLVNGTCRLCEAAIFASNNSNLTIGGTLTGGGIAVYNRNYFKNSNLGIVSRGINTLTIKGNKYEDLQTGIYNYNAFDSDIIISEENDFVNVDKGIIVREITGNLTVEGNTFNGNGSAVPIQPDYSSTAVTIQNYNDYANTSGSIVVSGNIINDCRIGIHALNIPNISIGADVNAGTGNIINFNKEKGTYHHGIWLESSTSANVQQNTITKNEPGFALEGITIYECTDALINMNTITDATVPVNVFGDCSDTEFHCNYIDNQNDPGVGVELNNAQLPDQGRDVSSAPPNGETWDNEWHGYTGGDYGVTGLPSQFTWYFDDSQIHFDPNPVPGVISADGLTSPAHFGCVTMIANDDPDRDVRYGALVFDTLYFEDYSSEFIYKSKEQLYALIKSDTTILTRHTANDSVFTRFYAETMASNIALFERVDSLIAVGSLDLAGDLNQSITDTNLIETNRKTVNGILINKVLMDVALSVTDSTNLEEIALQNPLTGGRAVYQARAILFMEMHYFNEDLRLSTQVSENISLIPKEPQSFFELIPNPANDKCVVRFQAFKQKFVLQVRQATGQITFEKELPPNTISLELNTSTMHPGVYFVFVNDGKSISEIKKLVVVR